MTALLIGGPAHGRQVPRPTRPPFEPIIVPSLEGDGDPLEQSYRQDLYQPEELVITDLTRREGQQLYGNRFHFRVWLWHGTRRDVPVEEATLALVRSTLDPVRVEWDVPVQVAEPGR